MFDVSAQPYLVTESWDTFSAGVMAVDILLGMRANISGPTPNKAAMR